MLSAVQVFRLFVVSLILWGAATLYIRLFPEALLEPLMGGLSFVTTFFFAWLSIVIIRAAGGLRPEQLIAGVSVVGAVAMMLDGFVLRWLPATYGSSEIALRVGAAWLLWGYGVSLAIALLMASRPRRPA